MRGMVEAERRWQDDPGQVTLGHVWLAEREQNGEEREQTKTQMKIGGGGYCGAAALTAQLLAETVSVSRTVLPSCESTSIS